VGCRKEDSPRRGPLDTTREVETMKITVTGLDPSPSSLRVGLRLEYSELGPIRFAILHIPWETFTGDVVGEITRRYGVAYDAHLEHEPLF